MISVENMKIRKYVTVQPSCIIQANHACMNEFVLCAMW